MSGRLDNEPPAHHPAVRAATRQTRSFSRRADGEARAGKAYSSAPHAPSPRVWKRHHQSAPRCWSANASTSAGSPPTRG